MKKKNFEEWQLKNKINIQHIFNLILSDLNDCELIINSEEKLYNDIVNYLYRTTFHVKYIN